MFQKLLRLLRGPKPLNEDISESDLTELAELIENGNPEDPETLERMATVFGQTEREHGMAGSRARR